MTPDVYQNVSKRSFDGQVGSLWLGIEHVLCVLNNDNAPLNIYQTTHTHTYTYTYTYTYTHTHTQTHINTHVHTQTTHMHACTHVPLQVHAQTRKHIYTDTHVRSRVHTYIRSANSHVFLIAPLLIHDHAKKFLQIKAWRRSLHTWDQDAAASVRVAKERTPLPIRGNMRHASKEVSILCKLRRWWLRKISRKGG
jgi:hypothetical protein